MFFVGRPTKKSDEKISHEKMQTFSSAPTKKDVFRGLLRGRRKKIFSWAKEADEKRFSWAFGRPTKKFAGGEFFRRPALADENA